VKHVDKTFFFSKFAHTAPYVFLKKVIITKEKSAFINIPSKYDRLEVRLLKSVSHFRTLVKHKDKRANYFSDCAFSWNLANHSDCVYPFTPNRSKKKTSF